MNTLILLLALGVGEMSNHNDMLKPSLDAYEEFRKDGCTGVIRKKLSPVTKHRPSRDVIVVAGQIIQLTCKRDTEELVVSWLMQPGSTPLHVEIHLNDAVHIVQASPWVTQVPSGTYTLTMFAVHEIGAISDVTEPVTFEIEVR